MNEEMKTENKPKPRGFAVMERAKVSEIARRGGVAAHQKGTAHKFTSEEARAAGRKGGTAPHKSRGRSVLTKPTETNQAKDENLIPAGVHVTAGG